MGLFANGVLHSNIMCANVSLGISLGVLPTVGIKHGLLSVEEIFP